MKKRILLCVLIVFLCLASGCGVTDVSVFLEIPSFSGAQSSLNALLTQRTETEGKKLLTPLSGDSTLSVSYVDFFNDGKPEVVCFYASPEALTITVDIYTPINSREYGLFLSFEVAGSRVSKVCYRNMDQDEHLEMILMTSTESDGVENVRVFCFQNNLQSCVFDRTAASFVCADMTGDGAEELLIFPCGAEHQASLIAFAQGQADIVASVPVSADAEVLNGYAMPLASNCMSCIFESKVRVSDRTLWVTDIIIADGKGGFTNVSYDESTACAYVTARNEDIPCRDVDFDGYLEIPQLNSASQSGDAWRSVNWYGIDETGAALWNCCTYKFTDDDWYFIAPESWSRASVTMERSAAGSDVTYSFLAEVNGRTHRLFTLIAHVKTDEAFTPSEGAFLLVPGVQTEWYGIIGAPDKLAPLEDAYYLTGEAEVKQRFVTVDAFGTAARAADLEK